MTVYGYARVSTVRQSDEGLSIEAQEQRIRGYARGVLQTDPKVVFQERGVSATVPFAKRPCAQELLSVLKPGDVLVALRLDRVFRSALDCLRMIEDLQARGVKLYLTDMGDVTENGLGKVFMTIAASFAELEREKIRERTLEVHAYRRSQGKHVAGRVPFGYVLRDGYLEEAPREQAALKRMRSLRAKGKSFRGIQADIKQEFALDLSPFGIQRIVEGRRQVPEAAIREQTARRMGPLPAKPATEKQVKKQFKKIRVLEKTPTDVTK